LFEGGQVMRNVETIDDYAIAGSGMPSEERKRCLNTIHLFSQMNGMAIQPGNQRRQQHQRGHGQAKPCQF